MKPITILITLALYITVIANENITAVTEEYPEIPEDVPSPVPAGRAYSSAAQTSSYERGYEGKTLRDQLKIAGTTAFLYYLDKAGLGYLIDSKDYYTIFAPSNYAMERLLADASCKKYNRQAGYGYSGSNYKKESEQEREKYSSVFYPQYSHDSKYLRDTILHQIIIGTYYLKTLEVSNGGLIPSVAGVPAAIYSYGDTVVVNGGTIIKGDLHATNGIVHVVDYVHCLHLQSVFEILVERYDATFEKCLEVMSLVNLFPLLTSGPPLTVLVPSKDELEALIHEIRYKSRNSPADAANKVIEFARTRILAGYYYPENLRYLSHVKTLFGQQVAIVRKSAYELTIGGYPVSLRNVALVTNGLVYFSESYHLGRSYGFPGMFGYGGPGYGGFGYGGFGNGGFGYGGFGYGGGFNYSPFVSNQNFNCGLLCGVHIL